MTDAAAEPLHLRFDTFELDEREARLTRGGQPLALPPKVFGVLCELARRPGQLITKSDLLDAVWGHQFVSDSVLKATISDLRATLGDDAKSPRYIETASRRGYRFVGVPNLPLGIESPAGRAAPVPPEGAGLLIGRDPARERLHAAWAHAAAGRRQVAWVAGEAGIGKTTLIERFIAELGDARVARGQCVEQHGAGEPYMPVLEALGSLCRDDAALPPLLRAVAPTWWLQLPWLGSEAEREALRRELAGSGQERMLREWGELLDRYTPTHPLLLVTEDLHWSDHATVRLIDHVARRRGPAQLMWLATYRLAEVIAEDHPMKALRHELRLHRLADEIVLDPFSEQEVADYVAGRFPGHEVPEHLAQRLHARTDGLPLFLVSVVDELESQGALESAAAAAGPDAAALPVPESLAGVIEKQIGRLAPDERALLEAASVCGVEFLAGTAADALEREAGWAAEICDQLVQRQQWLAASGVARAKDGSIEARYMFRHALYRQVFYQRCGATARARLHRRVATSLERRRSRGGVVAAAELATHYEQSHDPMSACDLYAEAAEAALAHFAPQEAMSLTEHALALLPSCPEGPERLAVEMQLLGPRSVAASQVLGVTAPQTRAAFARLDQITDEVPQSNTRVLDMGYGWALFVAGEYDKALAHADRKLALAEKLGDRVLHVSGCNLRGATLSYQGELTASREWLERGIAAAADVKDRLATALSVVDLLTSMHARLSQVLICMGDADGARQQIALAHARVDRIGQPYARRLVVLFEAFLEIRLERAERVRELGEAIERTAREHALAQAEGPGKWLQGWATAHLGDPLAGHALIREGYLCDSKIGVMRGRSGVLGFAAEAMILLGRWPEAQADLDEALELAHCLGERLHLPDLMLLQARIAQALGYTEKARASIHAAAQEAERQHAVRAQLAAMVAACELEGKVAEHDALAELRARVNEGGETPLSRRADALLLLPPQR